MPKLRFIGPVRFQGRFGTFLAGEAREVSEADHAYALSAYPDWFEDAGRPEGSTGSGDSPPSGAAPRTKPYRPRKG